MRSINRRARRTLDLAAGLSSMVLGLALDGAGALGQCEVADLISDDGSFHDRFGVDVAINGDWLIVGAFGHNHGHAGQGAAYVFQRQGTAWIQVAELLASDAAVEDKFGAAVDIDGDDAIVAASFNDDAGLSSGSVYIFHRQGSTWIQADKLTASDAGEGNAFGFVVAMHGDLIVIGAPGDDDGGRRSAALRVQNAGSAYVFQRVGTDWVEMSKLVAPEARFQDEFGTAVDVSGETIVVGARKDDSGSPASGTIYVFVLQADGWVQQTEVVGFNGAGEAVSIDGDVMLVGSAFFGFNNPGAAAVYRRTSATWAQESMLQASDALPGAHFGNDVSIEGDTALVAAWDHPSGFGPGAVYVFRHNGTAWQEVDIITPSQGGVDGFGSGIDQENGTVVLGALDSDAPQPDRGTAHVYVVSGPDCNGNNTPDACDIIDGTSDDADGDGVPDECPPLSASRSGTGRHSTPNLCAPSSVGIQLAAPSAPPAPLPVPTGLACDGSDWQVIYSSGVPDGVNALSDYEGTVDGLPIDREVADDFRLDPCASPWTIVGGSIRGVWFEDGSPGQLVGFRLRVYPDGANGPSLTPLVDQTTSDFSETVTGNTLLGRTEVCYTFETAGFTLNGNVRYWLSVQPLGVQDSFFQLTSRTGQAQLFGKQVYVSHPDLAAPRWTPGKDLTDELHDVAFTLFGAGYCASCPADLDDNEAVDILDFLALLLAWGTTPPGPPDFDEGGVGQSDFAILLGNWGACP